jgi:hypothetical protein
VSSWLLLFGLGVAWAVVLVPDLIRRNAASRRSDTIGQFARNLSSLQNSAPVGVNRPNNLVQFPSRLAEPVIDLRDPVRPVVTPARVQRQRPVAKPSTAQQRRKDVMAALVAAAILTFLGSLSLGGPFVVINALVDVALVAYVGLVALAARKEKARSQVGVLYQSPSQFRGVAPAYIERQRIAQ